jgi:hypothetical protein
MLVTFRTKAHADITMFGDVGVALLKLAGLSGTVPTAVLAADIPDALAKLEAGLATLRAEPPRAPPEDKQDDEEQEPPVPLARRAAPLIELLRAAAARNADVLVTKSGA